METATLPVPTMYADHHVLKVRQLLAKQEGIGNIHASSAFKQLTVEYDPAVISPEVIVQTLEAAGYPVKDSDGLEPPPRPPRTGDPAWKRLDMRMIQTNMIDIEMSGEFRKY